MKSEISSFLFDVPRTMLKSKGGGRLVGGMLWQVNVLKSSHKKHHDDFLPFVLFQILIKNRKNYIYERENVPEK